MLLCLLWVARFVYLSLVMMLQPPIVRSEVRAIYVDDAETITKLEDAVDVANKLRAETGVAATAATKRWKALKSARKVARGK